MNRSVNSTEVALYSDVYAKGYSSEPPFHPQVRYPEYDGPLSLQNARNAAYDAVRETLFLLGLDSEHYGLPNWNPLGELISPGQFVAIKPNLVLDRHLRGGDLSCVITHGSVIRALVDYVCIALDGRGRIAIGDAPLQMADFDRLCTKNGLYQIAEAASRHSGVPVDVIDFRLIRAVADRGGVKRTEKGTGDPNGYRVVDFGRASLLAPISSDHRDYRVTCYDARSTSLHHNGSKNEYLIARSILEADCIIGVSKLKTHRKAGITAALKNIVGINGHKDWLPHHRSGCKQDCGDEYLHPSISKRISSQLAQRALTSNESWKRAWHQLSIAAGGAAKRISRDPYTEGSWWGNDTLWRTVLDLNRALIYADRNGILHDSPQRKCLHLLDGIVAGEGEGPLEPDPKVCGLMLGGFSPCALDTVAAGIMGFDYEKIPTLSQAFAIQAMPLAYFSPADIKIRSNSEKFAETDPLNPCPHFDFRPSAGWQGHIERQQIGESIQGASLCAARY